MPESFDSVTQKLLDSAAAEVDPEKQSTIVKSLKTVVDAQAILTPEPNPVPEPTGFKAFLDRHADSLIKVGGTLGVVSIIAIIEAKGDVIFRSKATKYLT